MARATSFPWGTLSWGGATALAVALAVFAFGAPAWVLVPVAWVSATFYGLTSARMDRRTGRRS